jgi:hypothetical protein
MTVKAFLASTIATSNLWAPVRRAGAGFPSAMASSAAFASMGSTYPLHEPAFSTVLAA